MAAMAVIALLGFGLLREGDGGVSVGEPLPEGALPPLGPAASAQVDPAAFRDEWVLVNVWASWCEPCREESPALEDFARRNRGDVRVVGLATQDTTDDALAFVDELGLSYEQLHDGSGDYAEEMGTTGVPESVLVGPDGNVAYHAPGPVSEEILASEVEPLIREQGA